MIILPSSKFGVQKEPRFIQGQAEAHIQSLKDVWKERKQQTLEYMEYEPHNIPLVYVLEPKSKDAKAQADLHKTSKADLLKCFRTVAEVPTSQTSGAPIVDLSVIMFVDRSWGRA